MKSVLLERKEGISFITLNRPDRYNALNAHMLMDLLDIVKQVETNDDRVVIISGNGPAFSAGGDVKMLQQDFTNDELYDDVMSTIEAIMMKLYVMPKIVISAVQGPVAGLGLSLALTADYVVSHTESRFGVLFMGVGLVPDGGGHFWLSERLGVDAAKKFIWSMDQVLGDEAKKMGLADVVSDMPAIERAQQLAKHCLAAPFEAMISTKLMYHHKKVVDLKDYLNEERHAQKKLRHTEDHQEGIQAFLEKRAPVFNNN
ncbi:enoyl-CoA hydratase-related protein [Lentibacillus saliphilus]|uniref:enoyl-CoA hydratase-related protein n=1 Tax=Lentibacillus saliphilus TaxID=2737028 RepID=UPI001C30B7FF|nr:enoyl-CoA hydratase-related protein [Lentibacillus saliphilus]